MRGTVTRKAAAALTALALLAAGCAAEEDAAPSGGSGDSGPIVVGAVEFTENIILQEMYALVVEDAGGEAELKQPLASREVLFPAVEEGDVNLVPEYTGALTTFVTGEEAEASSDGEELVAELREALEPEGIKVLEPAPAQDQDALVVTPETAEEYDLETVSDLAPVDPPRRRNASLGSQGSKRSMGSSSQTSVRSMQVVL
jgi:osmoprotectant transport system substrate-binding protein